MATRAPESDGRRKAAAARRRQREAEIIAATRELFDQRGVREAQIEDIAKVKMPDLNAYDLDAAKEQVRGTARSMGLTVT